MYKVYEGNYNHTYRKDPEDIFGVNCIVQRIHYLKYLEGIHAQGYEDDVVPPVFTSEKPKREKIEWNNFPQ